MRIKFNWGTGIVLTLVAIVLFMGTLVYIATRQDFYLVEDDYYERGVNFQQQIEKRQNTGELTDKIKITQIDQRVEIKFPLEIAGKGIEGTVHFYSPVDKGSDFLTEIHTNDGLVQHISTEQLKKGRYIVKIDWKAGEKSFYQEENFNLQ